MPRCPSFWQRVGNTEPKALPRVNNVHALSLRVGHKRQQQREKAYRQWCVCGCECRQSLCRSARYRGELALKPSKTVTGGGTKKASPEKLRDSRRRHREGLNLAHHSLPPVMNDGLSTELMANLEQQEGETQRRTFCAYAPRPFLPPSPLVHTGLRSEETTQNSGGGHRAPSGRVSRLQ